MVSLRLNWQMYPVFERANNKQITRAKFYDNVCLQCCLGNNVHLCTKNKSTNSNEWIESRAFTGKIVKSIKLDACMRIECVVLVLSMIYSLKIRVDFLVKYHRFVIVFCFENNRLLRFRSQPMNSKLIAVRKSAIFYCVFRIFYIFVWNEQTNVLQNVVRLWISSP